MPCYQLNVSMGTHTQPENRKPPTWRNIIRLRKTIPAYMVPSMEPLKKGRNIPSQETITEWKNKVCQAIKEQIYEETRDKRHQRLTSLRGAASYAKAEDPPQALTAHLLT